MFAVAWQEIARCTGWNAPHRGRIDVSYTDPTHALAAGMAVSSDGVVDSIALHPGYEASTIVHEVAHAWVSFRARTSPPALDEGLTVLLTECVARNRPDLALRLPSTVGTLDIDLWAWSTPEAVAAEHRIVAYGASLVLARAAAAVVGERALWPDPSTPFLDWYWLSEVLARVPPRPAHAEVLEALGPSAEMGDLDGDGVTTRDEREDGTLPWDWDSDDDDNPDGRHRRSKDEVLLSLDGSPVCSGWRAKDDAAQFTFGADVFVLAPGAEAPSIPAVAVRAGDALYLSAGEPPRKEQRTVRTATLESSRGLERDPACEIPGRRTPANRESAFHPVFVRPPADDVERWIADAMRAGHEVLDEPGERSHVPMDTVKDARSAVDAAVWAWVPAQTTVFQRARAGTVAHRISAALGFEPEPYMFKSSSGRIVFADVAERTEPNRDAEALMVRWLFRVANRLPFSAVVADDTFAAVVERLRSYPDDSVLRALDDLAHKPYRHTDGWPEPERPRAITRLRPDHAWQCSGWRSAGNPPFDVAMRGRDGLMDLSSWNDDGRIVHGFGDAFEVWRAGGIRDDQSCGEAAGLVWVTRSLKPAPPKLLAAWSAERRNAAPHPSVPVQLGGPDTRQWNDGVIVSDALLAWGTSSGRWDVVAAALGALVDATARGNVVEEAHLRADLVPRFGADLPVFLGPPGR